MQTFLFSYRGNRKAGYSIVIDDGLTSAEGRFKKSLWRYKYIHPKFNAQLAWDTRVIKLIPKDIKIVLYLEDGMTENES